MCCTLSIPLHLNCGQWPPYIQIGHCNNGQSKHSSLLGSHQLGCPTIVGSCWLATVGLLGVHQMRKDRLGFWKLTVLLMANGVAMHCMLCASSRLRCFILVSILAADICLSRQHIYTTSVTDHWWKCSVQMECYSSWAYWLAELCEHGCFLLCMRLQEYQRMDLWQMSYEDSKLHCTVKVTSEVEWLWSWYKIYFKVTLESLPVLVICQR